MKKNLALTGMMGVGKTTIGKTLSRRLLMQFSDIDKIIEDKLKMSIKEIFKEKGELYFRKLEETTTLEESKKKNIIISLGGGAFINSKIRKNILSNSKSFWLDMDTTLLEARLNKSKERPLLAGKNLKESIVKIYKERKNTYALANYRVNCNKLNINSIINKIIKLYENN